MELIYAVQASTLWIRAWLQCITAAAAMTLHWPHKLAPIAWRDTAKSNGADLRGPTDLTAAIISAYHLFSSGLRVTGASQWRDAS